MFNQKEYIKKYRNKNRDKIRKQRKKYCAKNRDKIKEYSKKYYAKNRDKIREYRVKNRVKIRKQRKKYCAKNRVKINEYSKKYYAKNRDKIREYLVKNRVKINEYTRKKRQTDELYKAECSVRSRMSKAFKAKGFTKNKKTLEILGCTIEEFRKHIKSQFKRGMSWKNYGFGKDKWNYDHTIPLATAKTVKDLYRLNHYTNLQPMWQPDNLKKGAKILNSD